MERQHKIAILKYTTRNLWLLILPLIRGVLSLKFDIYHWLRGAYLDIFVFLVMMLIAYLRWRYFQFQFDEKGIIVKNGVLIKRKITIPYNTICSISGRSSLWHRLVKAIEITADTEYNSMFERKKKADIRIVINETQYSQILNNIPIGKKTLKIGYEASKKELIIFSFLFSSALSGIIFLATFFLQGSKRVDELMDEQFFLMLGNVTEIARKIKNGVVPLSLVVTMIIVAGWLISFSINLMGNLKFRISRCGKNIYVEKGYFTRWKYYVNYSRINYADLQQTLLMKIGKIMSLHISCTGYAKRKNDTPVFVPITTRKRILSTMKSMLPDFTISNIYVKTKRSYIISFIWLPMLLIAGLPVAAAALIKILPDWGEPIKFLAAMFEFPSVYFFAVRFAAKVSTGIGTGEGTITLRYCRGARFHTVIIPMEKVAYIKISRTPFQVVGGVCSVDVYTGGESVVRHRVKGIAFSQAVQFAEKTGFTG